MVTDGNGKISVDQVLQRKGNDSWETKIDGRRGARIAGAGMVLYAREPKRRPRQNLSDDVSGGRNVLGRGYWGGIREGAD